MSTEKRPLNIRRCTADECEVDVPDEFLILLCRRHLDGTAMCTSWTPLSPRAADRPSQTARTEAEKLAAEAMSEMRRGGGDG